MKKLYPLYFLSLLIFFFGSCSTKKIPQLSNNSSSSVNLLAQQDSLSVKSEPLIDSMQQKLTNIASVNVKTTEETDKNTAPPTNNDSNLKKLESTITDKTGLNVTIKNKKNNTGSISFEYKNLEQLNRILELIKSNY